MIWIFLYVLMVVATPCFVIHYQFDPFQGTLYEKRLRNFLLGMSCVWPVLWMILLVCLFGSSVVRPLGLKIHALLDEIDPNKGSEE
jgi:hypothetical protein